MSRPVKPSVFRVFVEIEILSNIYLRQNILTSRTQSMKMKRPNPFTVNPLTSLNEVKLVPMPPPVETHAPRTTLRSYLSRSGDGLSSLFDALGSPRGAPKKIEVIKHVPVAAPAESEED